MIRTAVINTKTNLVEYVFNYDAPVSNPPPGFGADYIAVANDQVNVGWIWNGTALAAPPDPNPPVATVLSQDLMAQFTAADATAIQAAISGNVQFWLLWTALTTQKDPMLVTNARFLAGWSALVQVLGATRMAAIATALGVTI